MVATTVKVAVAPGARVTVVTMSPAPLSDAQIPPADAHVQVAPLSAGGSESVTGAAIAVDGPALVTTIS